MNATVTAYFPSFLDHLAGMDEWCVGDAPTLVNNRIGLSFESGAFIRSLALKIDPLQQYAAKR